MLRSQSIVHIKCNQVTIEIMHKPLAKVMVHVQSTKDPTPAVEVDISAPLLRLALTVYLGCWLEEANRDLISFDRALLLRDAEDVRPRCTAIGDGISSWIFSKLLYWYLVGMKASYVELVVVLYVDRIKPRQ